MFQVFSGLKSLIKLEPICIDNNIFRLHYKATVIILIICSLMITAKQYIGDPILCKGDLMSMAKVVESYCWIMSTYTVPSVHGKIGVHMVAEGVGNDYDGADRKYHKYYQWVCFMLFFQAILFYIPRYIWKSLEGGRIKTLAVDLQHASADANLASERRKILCTYFNMNLNNHNVYFLRFLFCEILNLVNVIGQIYFIDMFLNGEFLTYGTRVLNYDYKSNDISDYIDPINLVFPKISKCTFHKFGPSGSIEKFDWLCIIPLNLVNEKIYLFLWFWLIILAALSGLIVIYRLLILLSPLLRYYLLRMTFRIASKDDLMKICERFSVGDWFVFWQMSRNVDVVFSAELICNLASIFNDIEPCMAPPPIGFKMSIFPMFSTKKPKKMNKNEMPLSSLA